MKVAQNKKTKNYLHSIWVFLHSINVENIEALLWNLNLSANHFFWRGDLPIPTKYALLLCEAGK